MNGAISCDELARLMVSAQRFAVFDVRERGEYNQCQIADTTSLPRSQIEFRVAELVPDRDVQVIVYDEGGARAPLALATLTRLGYQDVAILDGGLSIFNRINRYNSGVCC